MDGPLLALLVAGAMFAAGWHYGAKNVRADWTAERLQQSETARETERIAARNVSRIADDATRTSQRLAADAAGARSELARLRDVATAAGQRCDAAGTPPGGSTTTGPGVVLADLLGSASGRAAELAEALDAARNAGLACESAYDSLTRKP